MQTNSVASESFGPCGDEPGQCADFVSFALLEFGKALGDKLSKWGLYDEIEDTMEDLCTIDVTGAIEWVPGLPQSIKTAFEHTLRTLADNPKHTWEIEAAWANKMR